MLIVHQHHGRRVYHRVLIKCEHDAESRDSETCIRVRERLASTLSKRELKLILSSDPSLLSSCLYNAG